MAIRSTLVALVAVLSVSKNAEAISYENTYCADLKPQNIIDINQLMGMWYAVEIIPHIDIQPGTITYDSCPVVHISEGYDYSSSYQPSSYDYSQYQQSGYSNYQTAGYNSQYQPGGYNSQYQPGGYGSQYQTSGYGSQYQPSGYGSQYNQQSGYGYGSQTGYNSQYQPDYSQYQNTQSRYSPMRTTEENPRPGDNGYVWDDPYGTFNYKEYRGLRLLWDESDVNNKIEYNLRYNNTRRGFWVSSGPIGTSKNSQYSQFAGTIQVIKAVQDHLVLTICQRLPEAQLFTVILSREPMRLHGQVIHGIHQLLNNRDLTTEAIRKVCRNGGAGLKSSVWQMMIVIFVSIAAPLFRNSKM